MPSVRQERSISNTERIGSTSSGIDLRELFNPTQYMREFACQMRTVRFGHINARKSCDPRDCFLVERHNLVEILEFCRGRRCLG